MEAQSRFGFGLIGILLVLGALTITAGGLLVWEKRVNPIFPPIPPSAPTDPRYVSDELYCKKDSDCTTRPNCCNSCYKDYVNVYHKEPLSAEQCRKYPKKCVAIQDCPPPESFGNPVCRENKCTSSTSIQKQPEMEGDSKGKIPYDLLNLYDEYVAFQKENTGREFKPTYSLLHIYGDKVLVEAVASGDVNVLQDDLQKLGMTNTGVFGRMVSGRLPILSIDDLSGLDSLQFIRASYMTTQ